jgi:hypothetical protein
MNRPANNASLTPTLGGMNKLRYARLPLLAAASAFLAIPVAVCAAQLTDPFALLQFVSGRLAFLLSPGNLLTTRQPLTLGDYLRPQTQHWFLVISVDWLYWFLIFFGLSRCVSGMLGMRRSDE